MGMVVRSGCREKRRDGIAVTVNFCDCLQIGER